MSEVPSPTQQETVQQAIGDVDRFGPDSSANLDTGFTRNDNPNRDYWQRVGDEQLAARNSIAAEMNRDQAIELGLNRPEVSFDRDAGRDVDDIDFPQEPVRSVLHTPEERQPLSNLAFDRERDIDDLDDPIKQEPVTGYTALEENSQDIDDFLLASPWKPEILEPGFDNSLYGTDVDIDDSTEPFIDLRDRYATDTYFDQADEETSRQLEELEEERRRHDIEIAAAAAAIVVADELDLFPIDF
jgi:hypothetical protein